MKSVIYIFGGSGSGTTTLAKVISYKYGYFHIDTDYYFWLPTNTPFTQKRPSSARVLLMKRDIMKYEKTVISGSLSDWGNSLIPYFSLAIRLVTDSNVRISRLISRESRKFGERIDVDGDMYGGHAEFIEWAKEYDTGDINMRSSAHHDEWEKLLECRLMILSGELLPENNIMSISNEYTF